MSHLWLEDKLVAGGLPEPQEETIYGKLYLPRKFKIALTCQSGVSSTVEGFTKLITKIRSILT